MDLPANRILVCAYDGRSVGMIVTEAGVVERGLTDVLDEPFQITIRIGDLLCCRLDVRGQMSIARGPSPLRPGQPRLGVLHVVLDPMGQENSKLLDQLISLSRVHLGVLVMRVRLLVLRILIVVVVMMMSRATGRGFFHRWRCAAGQALCLFVDQNHAPPTFRARERCMLPTSALKTHRSPPEVLLIQSLLQLVATADILQQLLEGVKHAGTFTEQYPRTLPD